MAIKYEVRTDGHPNQVHVAEKGANVTTNSYAVHELWAIHDNGTEVFVCAHFGGCAHMSIHQLKKYFEDNK